MATFTISNKPYLNKDRVKNPTYDELIICSLCQGILWKPKACKNCETPYCSLCIKVRQRKTLEPIRCSTTCHCPGFIEHTCSRHILLILSRLEIKCRYTLHGCNEILPYNNLETHEEACDYQQKTCSGCQKQIAKKDFQDHYNACPLVLLTCVECNSVYKRQDQTNHTETTCLRIQLHQAQERKTNYSKHSITLRDEDLPLIVNFLSDYDKSVTWQLTHQQNINMILRPKLHIFFTQLGCNSDADRHNRVNNLITEYRKVLTIWRTHYQNIFKGLQPLLKKAVLDIRNTYNIVNN